MEPMLAQLASAGLSSGGAMNFMNLLTRLRLGSGGEIRFRNNEVIQRVHCVIFFFLPLDARFYSSSDTRF
jgi:hypothetical protein